MKRIIALVLIMMMVPSIEVFAENTYENADNKAQYAEKLYDLGLFKGTNNGFELDREATRTEAVIMLIRLLGEENEAVKFEGTHPFTDVAGWADNYIAYAYEKGYTKGIGNNLLGANDKVTSKQYCTFVLRALGYNDANGDFSYNESVEKAKEVGIVDDEYAQVLKSDEFLRGDCALISYSSLYTNLKDSENTLIKSLADKGVVEVDDRELQNPVTADKVVVALDKPEYDYGDYLLTLNNIQKVIPTAKYICVSTFNSFYDSMYDVERMVANSHLFDCLIVHSDYNPDNEMDWYNNKYIRNGSYETICIFDGEYNLCAYAVTMAGTDKKSIELTLCNIDVSNMINETKDKIDDLFKSVKEISGDFLYIKHKNYTEEETGEQFDCYYFDFDESKMSYPILEDAEYYILEGGYTTQKITNKQRAMESYSGKILYSYSSKNYLTPLRENVDIREISGAEEYIDDDKYDIGILWFNKNEELIGYSYIDKKVDFKVVEVGEN